MVGDWWHATAFSAYFMGAPCKRLSVSCALSARVAPPPMGLPFARCENNQLNHYNEKQVPLKRGCIRTVLPARTAWSMRVNIDYTYFVAFQ